MHNHAWCGPCGGGAEDATRPESGLYHSHGPATTTTNWSNNSTTACWNQNITASDLMRICDLTVYAVRTPIISDSLRATRSSRIRLLAIFDILNESKQIHLPGVVALQYCQQRRNLRTKACEGPVQTSASEPGFATALGPRFTRFATSKARPLALHISYRCSR